MSAIRDGSHGGGLLNANSIKGIQMLNMNVVNECITKVEELIPTRSNEDIAVLQETAVIDDAQMLSVFQTRKSVAQMNGFISMEVAQWLFNLMGEGGIDRQCAGGRGWRP